jgi:anti-sigma factor RsiW
MQCSKVQRLFNDLFEGRLSDPLAQGLRRHLDECTDCRVAHQRAVRLQRLLALKRYEQPAPEYFDCFLREFRQRLQADARTQAGRWEQFVASFTADPSRAWRYAFVGGVAVCLAVGVLMSAGVVPSIRSVTGAGTQAANRVSKSPFAAALSPASPTIPTRDIIPVLPRPAELSSEGSVVIIPADAHNEASVPRYVLDRITVTPANYEVASSINF